ncbi:MAG: hypothetical protein R3B93_17460 [Bacteroidia bacterium]
MKSIRAAIPDIFWRNIMQTKRKRIIIWRFRSLTILRPENPMAMNWG